MDLVGFDKLMINNYDIEFIPKKKIIDALNAFGYIVMKGQFKPLLFSDSYDKFIAFKLAQIKFNQIKDYLEIQKGSSFEFISSLTFPILFFDKDDFKLNDLETKLKIFQVIINNFQGIEDENEVIYTNKFIENKVLNKIYYITLEKHDLDICAYCCIIASINLDIVEFLNVFLNSIKIKLVVKWDFQLEELKDEPFQTILEDIANVFLEEDNYVHLVFQEGHIINIQYDIDEVNDDIQKTNSKIRLNNYEKYKDDQTKKNKNKRKRKKKLGKKPKQNQKYFIKCAGRKKGR